MHDVSVITLFEDAEYAAGLAEPCSTCFVLTNIQSVPDPPRTCAAGVIVDH